jgi:hypothetical protein
MIFNKEEKMEKDLVVLIYLLFGWLICSVVSTFLVNHFFSLFTLWPAPKWKKRMILNVISIMGPVSFALLALILFFIGSVLLSILIEVFIFRNKPKPEEIEMCKVKL